MFRVPAEMRLPAGLTSCKYCSFLGYKTLKPGATPSDLIAWVMRRHELRPGCKGFPVFLANGSVNQISLTDTKALAELEFQQRADRVEYLNGLRDMEPRFLHRRFKYMARLLDLLLVPDAVCWRPEAERLVEHGMNSPEALFVASRPATLYDIVIDDDLGGYLNTVQLSIDGTVWECSLGEVHILKGSSDA